MFENDVVSTNSGDRREWILGTVKLGDSEITLKSRTGEAGSPQAAVYNFQNDGFWKDTVARRAIIRALGKAVEYDPYQSGVEVSIDALVHIQGFEEGLQRMYTCRVKGVTPASKRFGLQDLADQLLAGAVSGMYSSLRASGWVRASQVAEPNTESEDTVEDIEF